VQTLGTHFSAIDGARKIPGVDISDKTIAEARGALALSCASVSSIFLIPFHHFSHVNG
jgi:hypothetical protein